MASNNGNIMRLIRTYGFENANREENISDT